MVQFCPNTIYLVQNCIGIYGFWSFCDNLELNGRWEPVSTVKGYLYSIYNIYTCNILYIYEPWRSEMCIWFENRTLRKSNPKINDLSFHVSWLSSVTLAPPATHSPAALCDAASALGGSPPPTTRLYGCTGLLHCYTLPKRPRRTVASFMPPKRDASSSPKRPAGERKKGKRRRKPKTAFVPAAEPPLDLDRPDYATVKQVELRDEKAMPKLRLRRMPRRSSRPPRNLPRR